MGWEKDLFQTEISDAKFSVDGKWVYSVVGSSIRKYEATTEFINKRQKKLCAFWQNMLPQRKQDEKSKI